MPCSAKKASARSTKPVTVTAFFVIVELDEGEPGVVVDDRVRVVVADSRLRAHPAASAMRAVAGDAVTRSQKARVTACIHVQQIAGTRPFVAVGRLPGRSRRTGDTRPTQHLPDGRVREAGRAGNQPRSPARLASTGADPPLKRWRELTRRAVRTTRPIEQTRQGTPRLPARLQPAVPPAVRRRRR